MGTTGKTGREGNSEKVHRFVTARMPRTSVSLRKVVLDCLSSAFSPDDAPERHDLSLELPVGAELPALLLSRPGCWLALLAVSRNSSQSEQGPGEAQLGLWSGLAGGFGSNRVAWAGWKEGEACPRPGGPFLGWGNTPSIALRPYVDLTDASFEAALPWQTGALPYSASTEATQNPTQ